MTRAPAGGRWAYALVALMLLVAAVLVAVFRGPDDAEPAADDGPDPTLVAPPEPGSQDAPSDALARFYTQPLTWERCQERFACARVEVPLDYGDPGGATIELALLKAPALRPDQRVGSLVVNPGGPGSPGTQYAAQSASAFTARVRDHLDVVGVDPRGTGSSEPVECLDDRQLDTYLAGDPDPDSPAEERDTIAANRAFGAGCAERSGGSDGGSDGGIAAHASTVEAARDMDVVRAVLGESALDYFGASYGTKLGATYAQLFPTRVGRFVLDGAVDPTLDNRELALEQARGFQTALEAYVGSCVAEGRETGDACFLGGSVAAGTDRIAALLEQVDAEPLPATGGRDLTEGAAFYGIVAPLYNETLWPALTAALRTALAGDGALLRQFADLYSSRRPDGTYADNSAQAISVISCLDDPSYATPAQVRASYAAFEEASPTFGRIFAWSTASCTGLQTRAAERPPTIRARGAAPIVVVGTTRDPATPYAWAQALARQLESGVLVTRDGDGHTGYNAGDSCVDDAVDTYLVEGTAPAADLRC